jgi:hypothetical protein
MLHRGILITGLLVQSIDLHLYLNSLFRFSGGAVANYSIEVYRSLKTIAIVL